MDIIKTNLQNIGCKDVDIIVVPYNWTQHGQERSGCIKTGDTLIR